MRSDNRIPERSRTTAFQSGVGRLFPFQRNQDCALECSRATAYQGQYQGRHCVESLGTQSDNYVPDGSRRQLDKHNLECSCTTAFQNVVESLCSNEHILECGRTTTFWDSQTTAFRRRGLFGRPKAGGHTSNKGGMQSCDCVPEHGV